MTPSEQYLCLSHSRTNVWGPTLVTLPAGVVLPTSETSSTPRPCGRCTQSRRLDPELLPLLEPDHPHRWQVGTVAMKSSTAHGADPEAACALAA